MSDVDLRGRHVLILNWRDTCHPEGGGSELYVEQMGRGLVDRGARVTMLCPRFRGSRRREVHHGMQIRRVGSRLTIYLLVPLMALFRRLPRHDVVVEIQNGVPFLASAYLRTPVLVVVHHIHREQWVILFKPMAARFGWWLESRVAPHVARHSHYVTVSEATRHELAGLGVDPARISVVHNGSPERGDVMAGERSATPEIVVLGRLVPHKRVEIAIDALRALAERHPDLRLTVVGEGWWHHSLLTHAESSGVADRVTFTGRVSEADKHVLLARAWVNVMPSVKEGWGLVVVEAGLHRTPTVAFRSAGGVRESIKDGETGLLADDPADLVACVERILDDEHLREDLGTRAEKHARSFEWPASQAAFAAEVAQRVRQPDQS